MADLQYQILDVLLFHILPRLPIKYVNRFLCVCKQWQSILKTPMFANIYHRHHPPKQLLIVLSIKTPCAFQTIDCESPENGLSTVSRPLPFSIESMSIIASVHGVVCARIVNKCNGKEYSDLILWNPLTSEYKTLAIPNIKECFVTDAKAFGLYYSCNDYKILLVTKRFHVYIYSLKSDSWRKVEMTHENLTILSSLGWGWDCWKQPCVLLNEKLYFLIRRIRLKSRSRNYSIIRFDLKTEKLKKISYPYFKTSGLSRYVSFMVVNECNHLYMVYLTTRLEIVLWRMDGDENWTKMVTYNPPSFLFGHVEELFLIKNENWFTLSKRKDIYKVDIEKHTKEKICSSSNKIFIHAGAKYTETLGINLFN